MYFFRKALEVVFAFITTSVLAVRLLSVET
jgi:hypothetical protein